VRGLTDAKAKANLGRVHLPASLASTYFMYFCFPTRIPLKNQLAELLQLFFFDIFQKGTFKAVYSTVHDFLFAKQNRLFFAFTAS
jgi:hypothetical protein